jgi:hypothetical protein
VKKVQRSFAVEYKSGRRKSDPKSNSIWGDMDLKSVAQDVQEAAAPFLPEGPQDGKAGSDVSLPAEEQAKPLLTLPIGQQTNAPALQEIIMTDENNTMISADAPATAVLDVPKKQRKPRAKKAAPAAASAEVAAEPAAGKPKRGRKPKTAATVTPAKRTPAKRAPRTVKAATAAPRAAIDEMVDLLQLEEENQRLRTLLAGKLRAENADLKKRLNLD